MSTKTYLAECQNCKARVKITYTTRTVIIGWSSEEVWPDTHQFRCPVCGSNLKQIPEVRYVFDGTGGGLGEGDNL